MNVSGPALGRDGKTWLIFASRRIARADGRFAGVAVAELRETYFEGLYANVDVGPHGIIALVTDDGIVAVRKPSAFIGSALHEAAAPRGGAVLTRSPFDGVTRLLAVAHLADYPFAVRVGVAPADYLAQWRGSAVANSGAVGAIVTLIVALVTGLGRQIRKRKGAEERLARLALADGLTGLANRRRFDEALSVEWRRGVRDGSTLALLMIDIDHFKAYNDHYGHLGGDEVLTAVAQTIAGNLLRVADLAARYGGEEFAVILPGTSEPGALEVAERIRAAICGLEKPHAGAPSPGNVTVSVGAAALLPCAAEDASALVRNADAALYAAKSNGRNRTALFAPAAAPSAPR